MNKDLYIALLEEHVDDLTTAMKIDTVLTSRKTAYMRNLENQLASVSDWNKSQDELISKIADTAMDYIADLNDLQADYAKSNAVARAAMRELVQEIDDLQADMAADHAEYRKTLEVIKEQNTRECDLNVRLQSKIAGLQDDILALQEQLGV
jgi:uncharacterized protein (DUF849 family)